MTWKAPQQGKALPCLASPRKKLSPEELVSIQICLNNVNRELEEAKKANNGGKMPYSAIPGTVLAKQHIFPWISVDQMKNELKQSAN